MTGVRIDRLLVERGLVPNRERAQRLVMAGEVLVDDRAGDEAGRRGARRTPRSGCGRPRRRT